MNTCTPGAWVEFRNAVEELSWDRAMAALACAKPLPAPCLPHLDLIRDAVFAAAASGPWCLVSILRERVTLGAHECSSISNDAWMELLAQEVFGSATSLLADRIELSDWTNVPIEFARAISVPRFSELQDVVVLQVMRDLVDNACAIEARIPPLKLNPDYGRLGKRTVSLEKSYLGEDVFILQVVAAVLRSLSRSATYERAAADALMDALQRLEWPTLQHMKWLISARLPCRHDSRWCRILARFSVRSFTARF